MVPDGISNESEASPSVVASGSIASVSRRGVRWIWKVWMPTDASCSPGTRHEELGLVSHLLHGLVSLNRFKCEVGRVSGCPLISHRFMPQAVQNELESGGLHGMQRGWRLTVPVLMAVGTLGLVMSVAANGASSAASPAKRTRARCSRSPSVDWGQRQCRADLV